LTSYLRPESRIQIWRTVQQRVAQIAPFLRLDTDPYPVLSAGKMYWIQDAYTDSDQFPYAYPHGSGFGDNLNYIRNSVKVVVDMYDGTVRFYVMDPKDPILAAYRRAFPGVFKDELIEVALRPDNSSLSSFRVYQCCHTGRYRQSKGKRWHITTARSPCTRPKQR